MILFQLESNNSDQKTDESILSNRKRLLIFSAGALGFVLVICSVLVTVFSGSGTVKDPIQLSGNQGQVLVSGSVLSKAQSIKPALTLAYGKHLLQTRWPVFVAVGAVLFVSILLAVLVPTLLHSDDKDGTVLDAEDSNTEVSEESETSIAPWKFALGVFGGLVLIFFGVKRLFFTEKPAPKVTLTKADEIPALKKGEKITAQPYMDPNAAAEAPLELIPEPELPTDSPPSTTVTKETPPPKVPEVEPTPAEFWIFDLVQDDSANPYKRLIALTSIAHFLYRTLLSAILAQGKYPSIESFQSYHVTVYYPITEEAILDVSLSSEVRVSLKVIGNQFEKHKEAVKALGVSFRAFLESVGTKQFPLLRYNRLFKHYGIDSVTDKKSAENYYQAVFNNRDNIL